MPTCSPPTLGVAGAQLDAFAGGGGGGRSVRAMAATKMHAEPKPGTAAGVWAKPAPGGVGILV
jgi:hypothetical protein